MDSFETILNSLPEKPARSRLDPYGDLISELLNRRYTYRDVARILLEKCGVHISISTIHYFVRTRSQSKQKLSKLRRPSLEQKTVASTIRSEEKEALRSGKKTSVNDDEVYQRIAALKQRPTSPPLSSKQFRYDPDEPLHLPSKTVRSKRE
jgi:hypothetical protein